MLDLVKGGDGFRRTVSVWASLGVGDGFGKFVGIGVGVVNGRFVGSLGRLG